MEKETVIRPSLLACDFLHLGEAVEEMISLHINSAHFDVMDGNFVPSISFGQPIFQSLKPYFDQISFDVHLMVNNPLEQMDSFFQLGSEEVTIHVESLGKEGREQLLLMKAKYPGRRIGLALSPESDISLLFPYLDLVDEILIICCPWKRRTEIHCRKRRENRRFSKEKERKPRFLSHRSRWWNQRYHRSSLS